MIFGKEEGYGLRYLIGSKETLTVFKYISTNNFKIYSITPSQSVPMSFQFNIFVRL